MNSTIEKEKLITRFEYHKGRYTESEWLSPGRFLVTLNDALHGIKEWTSR